MARRLVALCLIFVAPCLAQEEAPPTAPTRPLVFGDTPEGWRTRPAEDKPFPYDFDLPATGEAAARVNVLYYPVGFDEYRQKILGKWRHADDSPLTPEDQQVEQFDAGGLKVRTVDQSGTLVPREGAPRAGWRLVAAHIRAPGGQWTCWLIGPATEVARHRDSYLAWIRTARVGDAPAATTDDAALRAVRFVHGAPPHGTPSPWALLGYRVGRRALELAGARREDGWQLVVTVRSPGGPSLALLDGLIAATGSTPGHGTLTHTVVADGPIVISVRHRPTDTVFSFQLTGSIVDRFQQVAVADFPAAREALDRLPDADVFTMTQAKEQER
jgi:formylmethanofuran dehydrogenase subunit E